ncbi:hypothetical protein DRO33_02605, partial [Candidatus Bathyarchaeota archaeon]
HELAYGLEVADPDRPAKTITTLVRCARRTTGGRMKTYAVAASSGPRKLTPRECLRLQSFPDWWKFPPGTPTTAKYRMVGEAVPPVLAYRLAAHVLPAIGFEAPEGEGVWELPYRHRLF